MDYSEADSTRTFRLTRSPDVVKAVEEIAKAWPPQIDAHFGCRSAEEVEACVKLREELQDMKGKPEWPTLNIDDVRVMLRFARARKLNVKKSAELYRESHKWRLSVASKLEGWQKDGYVPPDFLDKFASGGFCSHDKLGNPLYIDTLGAFDVANAVKFARVEDLLDMEFAKLESGYVRLDEQLAKTRKLHTNTLAIFDLRGLSRSHMHAGGLAAFKQCAKQNDDNYPETPYKIVVIHAPFIFWIIWKICQLFFSEETREKIQIFGDGATATLLNLVDAECLPEFLGGKMKDPPSVRRGGVVPKDYGLPVGDGATANGHAQSVNHDVHSSGGLKDSARNLAVRVSGLGGGGGSQPSTPKATTAAA